MTFNLKSSAAFPPFLPCRQPTTTLYLVSRLTGPTYFRGTGLPAAPPPPHPVPLLTAPPPTNEVTTVGSGYEEGGCSVFEWWKITV